MAAPQKKLELYTPEYYAYCALGGILSCGLTHTAVVPVDIVKCRKQVRVWGLETRLFLSSSQKKNQKKKSRFVLHGQSKPSLLSFCIWILFYKLLFIDPSVLYASFTNKKPHRLIWLLWSLGMPNNQPKLLILSNPFISILILIF